MSAVLVSIDALPVTPLGIVVEANGSDSFLIRSASGLTLAIPFARLMQRETLASLCGGEAWLRRTFPGGYVTLSAGFPMVPTDFNALEAARYLARKCLDAEVSAAVRSFAPSRRTWRERLAAWLRRELVVSSPI
jgi:hypothetical protein